MAFDCRTHWLGDDQTEPRAVTFVGAPNVNNDVGLDGAHPIPHRRIELG